MYVKELGIFLTMKVLENTPAVLSLGKLCDGKRVFLRMDQWSKNPHLIKNGIRIILQHRELCSPSWFQACQVLPLDLHQLQGTPMRQESHSSSSSSSSPSPTVGEMSVREREDAPNSDISPVPVSELVDDRTGEPVENQANQIPKINKKRPR